MTAQIMKKRASGILLHITSLPSKYGIGDLGPAAYRFADFLTAAGQTYWQVLPLNPPTLRKGRHSPYNCLSAFAGNTLLISPDLLYEQGLLTRKELKDRPVFPEAHVNYHSVLSYKTKLLRAAFERFKVTRKDVDYSRFCGENKDWLDDFAVFVALRHHFRSDLWCNWPRGLRDRHRHALEAARTGLENAIERVKFSQYLFFKQWLALKRHCNNRGIRLIGDIPIYVAYESADVWAHPGIFKLTRAKRLSVVAGVPPDFFSRRGQLWGNPVYNWMVLKKTGYSWWIQRIRHNLVLFDAVRLDHFRGLVAFWQVPAGSKNAVAGKWVKGPKEDFFNTLLKYFPSPPIVVEDLGYITPDVRMLIKRFRFPCMKVLLFAFDGDVSTNPHAPHNHIRNCVVYTGTHDNNTVRGWFQKEATPAQTKRLFDYLGRRVSAGKVHWEFVRMAMSSVGNIVIISMQDVLGLGGDARMNRPATVRGNWRWRLRPRQITPAIGRKFKELTETYGRV